MSPLTKGCSSIFLLVAAIVALCIFGMRSCLSKYDERSALPPALYFKNDSSAVLLSMVKFSEANSYSESQGFIHKSVTNFYYLQTNDARTGVKIRSKKLGDRIKHFPEKMLGSDGRCAWLFFNELLAFDAFTLEKVADIQIIESKNPSLKGMLPPEQKYYAFNTQLQAIIFTATDGTEWLLHPKTLKATRYNPPPELDPGWTQISPRIAVETAQRISRLQEPTTNFNLMKISQDTINGKWWGLYSGKEIADLPSTISFSPAHMPDQRRQLYTASYDSTGPANASFKNASLLPSLQSTHFLDGGFLISKETALAVRLKDPAAYLLVYKTLVGDAGEVMVARVNHDGKIAWQLNTNSKNWIDYMIRDNKLIIFSNDNKELSSSESNLLMIVELASGQVRSYDFFEDEMRDKL